MRRAVSSVSVALGLVGVVVGLGGVPVAAAPAPSAPAVTPGKKRCTVSDERLRELSGLVATKTGYVVINDGTEDESRKRVFFLDSKCNFVKSVRYSGRGPLDTEDLALSPDGKTLWIADIGDNITSAQRRERVALWSMPLNGNKEPVLHRVAYPEAKPHDAEALLIGDDGVPLIITKTIAGGTSEIFAPTGALKINNDEPVPMKKVGAVTLPKTDTPNVLGVPGRVAVTGAARSPDGSRVVLRTYADAFEYDVSGGDVVKALTTGKPRVTPLADPFGESISYTPDGAAFVTVSDAGDLGADEPVDILAYTPSTRGADPAAAPPVKKAAEKSWTDALSLQDITYIIAAVGVLGALLAGAGVFGIVRSRRRRASTAADVGDDLPGTERGRVPDPDDDAGRGGPGGRPDDDRRGRRGGGQDRRAGGVYGGAAKPGGAVYGAASAGGPPPPGEGPAPGGRSGPVGGGVYGGSGGAGRGGGPGDPGRGGGSGGTGRGGVYGGGGRPAGGGGVYGGGSRERGGQPDAPRDGRDYRPDAPRGGPDQRGRPERGRQAYGGGRDHGEARRGARDPRDYRDARDAPDGRGDPREYRDPRAGRAARDGRDYRDPRDDRDRGDDRDYRGARDGRDYRDYRDERDGRSGGRDYRDDSRHSDDRRYQDDVSYRAGHRDARPQRDQWAGHGTVGYGDEGGRHYGPRHGDYRGPGDDHR